MSMRMDKMVCCCVLLASLVHIDAQARKEQKPQLSFDPIFGLFYDHNVIKYELLPAEISRKCSISNSDKKMLGVFARVSSGKSDYYIVKETIPIEDDYGWGTALWIEGSKCQTTGTDDVFFGVSSAKGYDEATQRGLVRDALQRGIRAYGGDVLFRKKACSQNSPEINNSSPYYEPIIRQELQAYCSMAPQQ